MTDYFRPEVDKDKKFLYVPDQVLCTKGKPWGNHYWEADWDISNTVKIAVACEDIKRRSYENSEFGKNNKSWSLDCCSSSGFRFSHDNKTIRIDGPITSRVGVYLDRSAKSLSFYGIYDQKATLLHRVTVDKTYHLYPGFLGKYKIC